MARGATGWAGTRQLMQQLRGLLQQGGLGAERLNQLPRLIANNMVAEVCSLYVTRAGETLELFATQGLKPEAVHRTRFRFGEGLVGKIAATGDSLALADAQTDPNFAYRPEIGEESFKSLLGVPIQREGQVLGVLVVQNVTRRGYTAEEREALETVAMVVAELLIANRIVDPEEQRAVDSATLLPGRLSGIGLNEGQAIGVAVPHQRGIVIKRLVAEDPAEERTRLSQGMAQLNANLDLLFEASDLGSEGEHRDVLETYRMFAADRGWAARIEEAISSGLTAEAAVQRVQTDMRRRMQAIADPYLRERMHDFDDLANRLLSLLTGDENEQTRSLPEEAIVIARTMGPAELLEYDRERLRGVVLGEGGPTAHVAIIARALDIPMVGRCPAALTHIRPGDPLLLDGGSGVVLLRPREQIRRSFRAAIEDRAQRRRLSAATRELPAVTKDGRKIALKVNAGLLIELPQLHESGAEGIGLFRTEVPFMVRDRFPSVSEQRGMYATVLEQAQGKEVVFRTLDVGGDKALPYWERGEAEENPALGWRALRIGLDRPVMLRRQLRALVQAAAGQRLKLMFPMVTEVREFREARRLLDLEIARTQEPPSAVEVGAMLEVPALFWQLDELFEAIDFLSIGSNDLLQFFFAADRSNPTVSHRYGLFSVAGIRMMEELSQRAKAAEVPLTLCGELAGNPLTAMLLIACGLESLSMSPSSVPSVRMMIRSMSAEQTRRFIDTCLARGESNLSTLLRDYARDHGVTI